MVSRTNRLQTSGNMNTVAKRCPSHFLRHDRLFHSSQSSTMAKQQAYVITSPIPSPMNTPSLQQPKKQRLRRRRRTRRQLLHPPIIILTTILLLLLTTTQAQQHHQSPLFTTLADGGDVMLRRRKSFDSTKNIENGGQEEEESWVVYDFKPAFPPYTVDQMTELLMIPKLQTNDGDGEVIEEDDEVAVEGNNTANEEEDSVDETSSEDNDQSADDMNEEETINTPDDHDGEVGVEEDKSSSSEIDNDDTTVDSSQEDSEKEEAEEEEEAVIDEEEEQIATEDDDVVLGSVAPEQSTDNKDDDNNNDDDVVEVTTDEDVNDSEADPTQIEDVDDATISDSDEDVATFDTENNNDDAETIEEGSPESKEEHNADNESDVVPAAVDSHDTVEPPTGPLPEPGVDTDTKTDAGGELDETSEEEIQPAVEESESGIETSKEDEEDEEEKEPLQQQTNVEDVAEESNVGEATGINEESSEGPAEIIATDGVSNDREMRQDVEPEGDTINVIDENSEAPIVLDDDDDAPSLASQSFTEASPDTEATVDEGKINIQYDDPLPPTTSSSPPSSNNKDANREFVTGLDDVDKLFESVEVPDELDVGADGSSMQDVLVGQALKIITKKAKSLGGAIKVKFDKIATPVKKALPQLGLFGGDDDDEDETEIDALFERLVNGNGNLAKPDLPEDDADDDEGNKLTQKIQQLKEKVKELPLVKSDGAQKVIKFTKDKWDQGKQLLDDLLNIFEGDDEDDVGDFDLSKMNLDDIQSLVR